MARLVTLSLLALLAFPAATASARILEAPAQQGSPWVELQEKPLTHEIVRVVPGASITLRSRPSGPTLARAGSHTAFGSPRAYGVVGHRGHWLAVTDPSLGNGRQGWVDTRAGGLRLAHTRIEVEVDLSARTLLLRKGDTVVRRARVGIGRPGSTTPTGRFAVTDKLEGPSYSAYYGCCILALSAKQPHLPPGWSGGDRIAIHGTPNASDFGRAVSAGCLHAADADLRYLMRTLPLGTPVVIHP